MLLDVGGWEVAGVLDVQSFLFIKENWPCGTTRHHAESKPFFNDTVALFAG